MNQKGMPVSEMKMKFKSRVEAPAWAKASVGRAERFAATRRFGWDSVLAAGVIEGVAAFVNVPHVGRYAYDAILREVLRDEPGAPQVTMCTPTTIALVVSHHDATGNQWRFLEHFITTLDAPAGFRAPAPRDWAIYVHEHRAEVLHRVHVVDADARYLTVHYGARLVKLPVASLRKNGQCGGYDDPTQPTFVVGHELGHDTFFSTMKRVEVPPLRLVN